VRFARALALGGLSFAVVSVAACGDEDTSGGDTSDVAETADASETTDIADVLDVADTDVAETRETDTRLPDADMSVDGPLAPPDMPARA